MKKILNLFLCFIICLGFLAPNFFGALNNTDTAKAVLTEEDIVFVQDIVGINYDKLNSSLKNNSVENQNPYSTETKKMLSGVSIEPTADKDNQIFDMLYTVEPFSMKTEHSIFMWIYLPDAPITNCYNLEISFMNRDITEKITWQFSFEELDKLLSKGYKIKYGWKLFELNYNDGEKTNQNEEIVYEKLKINYYLDFGAPELNEIEKTTNGKLSFYHIYLGFSTTNSTNIALHLDYAYYKVNSKFENNYKNLCYNDEFLVGDLEEIFDYLFVGKNNVFLLSSINNKFEWEMYIDNDNGRTDVFEGYNFKMSTLGANYFNITLKETRSKKQKDVFNISITNFCKEYSFGYFNMANYSLKQDNTLLIYLKLNDNFDLNDINIQSSNKEIFRVNSFVYEESVDLYYVYITGVKNGSAELIATANGSRLNEESQDYSISVNVKVTKPNSKFLSLKTFLVIGGFYGVATAVFSLFTFINIKRVKKKKVQK